MPLTISSISHDTSLNQYGGDELTISGSGLPQNIDDVDVTFSDGTKCQVSSTSDSELKCITDGFDSDTIDTATPYTVSVKVNNSVTDSS